MVIIKTKGKNWATVADVDDDGENSNEAIELSAAKGQTSSDSSLVIRKWVKLKMNYNNFCKKTANQW